MKGSRNSAENFFDRALGIVCNDENEKSLAAKINPLWFRLKAHGGTLELEMRQQFALIPAFEERLSSLFPLKQRGRGCQNCLVVVIA